MYWIKLYAYFLCDVITPLYDFIFDVYLLDVNFPNFISLLFIVFVSWIFLIQTDFEAFANIQQNSHGHQHLYFHNHKFGIRNRLKDKTIWRCTASCLKRNNTRCYATAITKMILGYEMVRSSCAYAHTCNPNWKQMMNRRHNKCLKSLDKYVENVLVFVNNDCRFVGLVVLQFNFYFRRS